MQIDPDLVDRFIHDVAKPIKTFLVRMDIAESTPGGDKELCETLKSWREPFASAKQALEDFQCLAGCSTATKNDWETFEWKQLIADHMTGLQKAIPEGFTSEIQTEGSRGYGDTGLIRYALQNMVWFASHFQNRLRKLSVTKLNSSSGVSIRYEIASYSKVQLGFAELTPFFPMSRETLSLTHNTGLLLSIVKTILELNEGSMRATVDENNIYIELYFVLTPAGKDNP